MLKQIRKRNGTISDFNQEKITNAIWSAAHAVKVGDRRLAQELSDIVVKKLIDEHDDFSIPHVEDIQDNVERVLVENGNYKIAKAFILYRHQHKKLRDIDINEQINRVNQYLKKDNWEIKENSNMAFSLQGLNYHISSGITKTYWLNEIYPREIRKAHIKGDLHIHDLSIFGVYCVGWDLFDLLQKGFKGAAGKIESKPPEHFSSALGQIVNFFYTLQGEAAGALAFSNFDTLLAPFIHYDKLEFHEVKRYVRGFFFNMNVPTRVGFQTPFSNITLDLNVPHYYRDKPVMIGGNYQVSTYGDFQTEMNIFNQALLEVLEEGDSRGRVFTFPIPTYNITKDFQWNSDNTQRIWRITGKYGIPYFSNYINSDMDPEDARSMCCRLRIDNRKLERRGGGGLFGSNPLTGSIGVVTINMARLGHRAKTKEDFFKILEELIFLSKESLQTKRKVLERFTEDNLYPYSKFYLRNIKERYGEYWKNHFSTIGLIGMNECCLNFLGVDIGSKEGRLFSLEVLDFMRDALLRFKEESGYNYNLEATPAEGTSYRLAKLDKKKFPNIICANEKEYRDGCEPYYTNSSHLPVNYSTDIFEVLDKQDELQTKYTGGTVIHLYIGERPKEFGTVGVLVRKICEEYHLPYFTITPTFSVCSTHGYVDGEQEKCPKCGNSCEIYSRIVGYLRPISQWNKGKLEEFGMRKMFSVPIQCED